MVALEGRLVFVVYVGQDFPQVYEFLAQAAVVAAAHVEPEFFDMRRQAALAPYAAYDFFLVFVEVVGLYFLDIPEVAKYIVGIDERLVYLVEVVEHHVAPEDEAVELPHVVGAPTARHHGPVCVVEHEQQFARLRRRVVGVYA